MARSLAPASSRTSNTMSAGATQGLAAGDANSNPEGSAPSSTRAPKLPLDEGAAGARRRGFRRGARTGQQQQHQRDHVGDDAGKDQEKAGDDGACAIGQR